MPTAPRSATTMYKVVAVVSPTTFVSIFDGRTKYSLDTIAAPRGGCWVSPDLLSVIQHANHLPVSSARLGAPRAILQVAAWCDWPGSGQPPRAAASHAAQHSTKVLV